MSRVRFLSPAPARRRPVRRPWQDRRVTSPSGPLVELAHAYGVMTEYVDFRGQTVEVTAETITAVLQAMDVDVADPAQALAEHDLETLATDGAAVPGGRAGRGEHLLGARRRRRPGPARGRARGRHVARARPGGPLGRATRRGRHAGRGGDIHGAHGPATRLPHAARHLRRREGHRHAHRDARVARAAGGGRRRALLGLRGPALQRPLARLVGRRRPGRPRRARDLVRRARAPTTCW